MIKKIELVDQEIITKILKLQKKSYQVEAELIGFFEIPNLKDTIETIKNSDEIFYGYFNENNCLAGMISYKIIDGKVLDIHRLAIDPYYFRKGIAKKLLNFVESLGKDVQKIIVSTGTQNTPAVQLYLNNGFKKLRDVEICKNVYISEFEKKYKN